MFLYVELPQAWAVAVPAIGANVLFLMKETSIVSAVGIAELLFVTKDIIGMDYKTNEALFLLFASYLIILPARFASGALGRKPPYGVQNMVFDWLFEDKTWHAWAKACC